MAEKKESATVTLRIDPELKEESTEILNSLGMTVNGACSMFLKQVVLHRGLPFEVTLGDKRQDS